MPDNNRHGNTIITKIISKSEECTIVDRTKDGIRGSEICFECRKAWDFHKRMLKNISDEEARDYEMLRLGVFESLKPKDQMQAILCDKIVIDAWRLRKVLAFEQGAAQLEILNLDVSSSAVELIRRESLIRNYENHKAEWTNLNQLKKWLTTNKTTNLSHLSKDSYELLEEIVQKLPQHSRAIYRHMDIELLGNCEQLSEFCTWNELDLNKFKADLLERALD